MASHTNQNSQSVLTEPTGMISDTELSQLQEVLSNEKLKLVLNLTVTLIASYVTSVGSQALKSPAATTTAADLVAQLDMFAFSLLGLFTASLSTITFHRHFPQIAGYFESISVFFLALAFANLVSIILPDRHRWIPYMACMIPVLPLILAPCKLLLAKLDFIKGLPMWRRGEDTLECMIRVFRELLNL